MAQRAHLSTTAQGAAERLQLEFGSVGTLDTRKGELEFSIPAPTGSRAGHLVAFSNGDDLWVRFAPPYLCYAVDDKDEMLSVLNQLIAEQIAFKVVMSGDEWVETTLVKLPHGLETQPGRSFQLVSWSGKYDHNWR
jgi:hypothetical protein